jgi:hypothetical protein
MFVAYYSDADTGKSWYFSGVYLHLVDEYISETEAYVLYCLKQILEMWSRQNIAWYPT